MPFDEDAVDAALAEAIRLKQSVSGAESITLPDVDDLLAAKKVAAGTQASTANHFGFRFNKIEYPGCG